MSEKIIKNKATENYFSSFSLKKFCKKYFFFLSKNFRSIYSRRFLLSLLLLLILVNYLFPKNKIEKARLDVARWPFSAKKHLKLIKTFFDNGNSVKSKEEIRIIEMSPFMSFNIKLIPNLKKEFHKTEAIIELPDKTEEKINQLETLLLQKPYYRDLYLRLSLLYLQIWKDEEAKQAWQTAYYLDPNSPQVKQLGKLIEELL